MTDASSRRLFLQSAAAAAAFPAAIPAAAAAFETRPTSFPPLRKRVLGRTGLRVTELGAGCEVVSDVAVLQRALELGVNFFDTARSYQAGNNERFLRAALGSRRKEVVLSTRSYAKDAKALAAELDESLEALGVSQIDVWYIGNKSDPAEVTDEMLDVQRKPGAHGAAIRWALRDARVQTTSVRMVDLEQLEENVRAMAGSYSPADDELLAARAEAIAPRYCRMCGACEGACPSGVDIATLVRCVSYVDGYGSFDIGADRWSRLDPRARDVRCGGCASCPVRCPNGVHVREQLTRAQALFG